MGPAWKRVSGWPLAVPVVAALAGLLFAASAFTADGTDLRSTTTDLATLVSDRAEEVSEMRERMRELRSESDRLNSEVQGTRVEAARDAIARLEDPAGMTPASGSGLVVTLDDAPDERLDDPEVDVNLLVVHQQDIQGFVNALWAAGAEAISLQGQRLISTTGIKCVGNTVVLQGVPYSPPYEIVAIGDIDAMQEGLKNSRSVQIYQEYANKYGLGLSVETSSSLDVPAYEGSPRLQWAKPLR